MTSLDMAGCSLSVTWLDEELERLWSAPADTPAFRRGNAVVSRAVHRRREAADEAVTEQVEVEASRGLHGRRGGGAQGGGGAVRHGGEEQGVSRRIDAVAGDGDHGIGMSRGSKAAAEAAESTEGGVQTVLAAAGSAFGDKAGGTSGILWGLLFDGVGQSLGNIETVTADRLVEAVAVRRPTTCRASARPSSGTRPCSTRCSRSWTP